MLRRGLVGQDSAGMGQERVVWAYSRGLVYQDSAGMGQEGVLCA